MFIVCFGSCVSLPVIEVKNSVYWRGVIVLISHLSNEIHAFLVSLFAGAIFTSVYFACVCFFIKFQRSKMSFICEACYFAPHVSSMRIIFTFISYLRKISWKFTFLKRLCYIPYDCVRNLISFWLGTFESLSVSNLRAWDGCLSFDRFNVTKI